jgi:hypothetical protein
MGDSLMPLPEPGDVEKLPLLERVLELYQEAGHDRKKLAQALKADPMFDGIGGRGLQARTDHLLAEAWGRLFSEAQDRAENRLGKYLGMMDLWSDSPETLEALRTGDTNALYAVIQALNTESKVLKKSDEGQGLVINAGSVTIGGSAFEEIIEDAEYEESGEDEQ